MIFPVLASKNLLKSFCSEDKMSYFAMCKISSFLHSIFEVLTSFTVVSRIFIVNFGTYLKHQNIKTLF